MNYKQKPVYMFVVTTERAVRSGNPSDTWVEGPAEAVFTNSSDASYPGIRVE